MRNRWQDKRKRQLERLAQMRDAKARKRLSTSPPELEPKMERYYPLEVGFRDKSTKEEAWTDFRSVRQVIKSASLIQNLYRPGIRSVV